MKTITKVMVSMWVGVLSAGCGQPSDSPDAVAVATAPVSVRVADRMAPAEQNGPPTIEVLKPAAIRALIDQAKGTVVVANFWATWCPPCVEETPDLISFYGEYHGKGVTFLSLSVDDPSTVEKAVKPFVAEHKIPFSIYVVDEGNPKVISEVLELGMSGAVPTTWVIDRRGMPVRSWVGEVTAAELAAVVKPLLVRAPRIPHTFR